MNSLSLVFSIATILTMTASNALAKNIEINTSKSHIAWLGKKVTGQHNGTVALKSGKVDLDGKNLKGGKFEIDMTSITVEDLKDPEYNAKLTGHLKSDDFFSVEKFPTSTFVITSVKPLKNDKAGTSEIKGDLTIKGITQSITFPAKVEIKDGEAHAKGKAIIDRTKYNIRYGSGKFFENLGDKMINDNFEMDLDLTAKL